VTSTGEALPSAHDKETLMTEYTGTTVGDISSTGTSPLDETNAANGSSSQKAASDVAQDAAAGGKQTVETAKEQAAEVAHEATSQARELFEQARQQLTEQGSSQQEKAASGLRSLADELTGMVEGQGAGDGLVSDLAQQASTRVRDAASWLESRQPGDVLDEVREFARRRPGAFLLSAAAVGLVGGRLTRGLSADAASGDAPLSDRTTDGTTGASTSAQPALVDPVLPVTEGVPTSSPRPVPTTTTESARVPGTPGYGQDRI
jgi:hypothetical protein